MFSRLSIMERSTLSALTKISKSLGVLQHLIMTLTECGDTVLVREYTGYLANILSFEWVTQLS